MSIPDFEYLACPIANCGGFWLPANKIRQLRESHAMFYCPSGHAQWLAGKSEQEKRIEELKKAVAALTRDRDNYKHWYEEERRLKINYLATLGKARLNQYALKGHIGRLKKRVANG